MKIDTKAVAATLNKIMEYELAGTVRYTHYSLMTYGYNRIPIVSWLRGQATESLDHAQQAGELITQLGEHPSLAIGPLLETHKHDMGDILRESLQHERESLALYYSLLEQVEGKSIQIEEYAREMIRTEEPYSSRTCASNGSMAGPSSSTRVGIVHHPHGLDLCGGTRDFGIGQHLHAAGSRAQETHQWQPQLR